MIRSPITAFDELCRWLYWKAWYIAGNIEDGYRRHRQGRFGHGGSNG